MGSLSSSPRINDCPCYVKHPTTERAPRAHPHETSDGSGRRGGGRGERYLSRAVARARILNNSWSAEEVENLATPGHFGFSINIPPPPRPRPAKSVGPRAQHRISETLHPPSSSICSSRQIQNARPSNYIPRS